MIIYYHTVVKVLQFPIDGSSYNGCDYYRDHQKKRNERIPQHAWQCHGSVNYYHNAVKVLGSPIDW